jgi:hypothetical protein
LFFSFCLSPSWTLSFLFSPQEPIQTWAYDNYFPSTCTKPTLWSFSVSSISFIYIQSSSLLKTPQTTTTRMKLPVSLSLTLFLFLPLCQNLKILDSSVPLRWLPKQLNTSVLYHYHNIWKASLAPLFF